MGRRQSIIADLDTDGRNAEQRFREFWNKYEVTDTRIVKKIV